MHHCSPTRSTTSNWQELLLSEPSSIRLTRKKSSVRFNSHSPALSSQHAMFSPSSPAWVNYDEEKTRRVFFSNMAAAKGTRLHELAYRLIRERVRLPEEDKTLNLYVNDAIGYGMMPEIMLFFSENFFGTADTLGFRKDTLRIHDLKNGSQPAKMIQLMIYAALFCLEYEMNPRDIKIELRIYQSNRVVRYEPTPPEIYELMNNIRSKDKLIESLRMGD